jgi:Aldehyde dehydrogenase family
MFAFRNLALSLAAGNATLWKPSPSTPLCSIAITKIISRVLERNGIPGAVAGLVIGGKDVGAAVVESQNVDLGKEIPLGMRVVPMTMSCSISLFYGKRSCGPRSRQEGPNAIR